MSHAFSMFSDDKSVRSKTETKKIHVPKKELLKAHIASETLGHNDRWPIMGVLLSDTLTSSQAKRIQTKIEAAVEDERLKHRVSQVALFCPIMKGGAKPPAAPVADSSSDDDQAQVGAEEAAAAAGAGARSPKRRSAAQKKADAAAAAAYFAQYNELVHRPPNTGTTLEQRNTRTRDLLQKMSVSASAGRDANVNITQNSIVCFDQAMAAFRTGGSDVRRDVAAIIAALDQERDSEARQLLALQVALNIGVEANGGALQSGQETAIELLKQFQARSQDQQTFSSSASSSSMEKHLQAIQLNYLMRKTKETADGMGQGFSKVLARLGQGSDFGSAASSSGPAAPLSSAAAATAMSSSSSFR
jgi:hypothetical protein